MASTTYTILPKDDGTAVIRQQEKDDLGSEAVSHQQPARWKLTLQLATLATATVLLVNVIITVYFAVSNGLHGGNSILYHGDCAETARLSTWSHIGINILSTILLSGSNNAQQYLSAPTRAELDRAHAAKEWLDIGIPSIRNLFSSKIGPYRRILWGFLALGSIPLHWVYNSAMFASLSAKEYSVLVVSPDFIDGTNTGFVDPVAHVWNTDDVRATNESVAIIRKVMNTFERLDVSECVTAYAQQVVSSRRDLIVVVDAPSYDVKYCPSAYTSLTCFYANPNVTNSIIQIYSSEYGNWIYASTSYAWMCADYVSGCGDPAVTKSMKTSWTLYDYPVDYCLSERVQEDCTFRMSVPIMLIVCVCNITKLVCLVLALLLIKEAPLLTIGDAVASFMRNKDPNTTNMALVPRSEFDQKSNWKPKSLPYDNPRRRYFSSASSWKWWICNLLYTIGIGLIAGLMGRAIHSIALVTTQTSTGQLILTDGFGKIVSRNLLTLTSSFVPSVLLANFPQLVLSAIYLTYNALATSMSVTREYVSYSIFNITKKGNAPASLRVSNPTEESSQRRAYYLQLPFRFAIPLMAGSTVLHWLTSQSLFLAKVDIYHSLNTHTPAETEVIDAEASLDTTGFSVLPMICALIIAVIMTLILNGIALRRITGAMPIAGSCSAAIAASCHGRGCGLGPVTWGVVDEAGEHLMRSTPPDADADDFSNSSSSGKLGFVDGTAGCPVQGQFYF
ncbi:uncharacterized protein Z520_07721 [Fonsecaea multimorphosa CBS 102226]|uniref:DUF6536 domain-containing protein n=1 Tax=Fonsecaea multimorphosa CBS 102226 TaxID=1442371 RepID=A0A0D2H3P7_9EURO|nr:uncharacterized protein Z520_07721 [Fonsecaea multimorphosa CBS 102226]KIX96455.1 hypothetical protein Z520_07721 [Fonsecaea multimorphosa CBS 102226]OAL22365.1 hypothetical protein AYO22_07409 [Fonsecaea multimorphosa]